MNTHDEQPDTSPWRAAPPHLMTRRQLRAAGLAPGGAQPVAVMVRQTRRRRIWAALFDSTQAPAKRTATPAQLDAVAKAVRGRKLRAAERRGLTEADLTQVTDPGPAWTPTSSQERDNPMNDNQPTSQDLLRKAAEQVHAVVVEQLAEEPIEQQPDEIRDHAQHLNRVLDEALRNAPVYVENATPEYEAEAASSAEVAVRAQERFEEYLQQHRDVLGEEPQWRSYFEIFDRIAEAEEVAERIHDSMTDDVDHQGPAPVGRGQRVARLHALVAVNRARDHRAQMQEGYAQLIGETTTDGVVPAEVVAIMDAERTAAEARMAEIPWSNPDACSMMLTEALAWRDESPLAAQRADELIGVAASEWGVLIDPETYTVSMDPQFTEQAVQRQQYAEAAAVWTREQYAAEALTEAPLTDAVKDAVLTEVHRWAGVSSIDPNAMLHHADTTVRRRADLATALDSMRLSEADRAVVDFTVDYLRGDLTGVDLLDTPVSVDPGVEARGRIAAMMHRYAAGEIPGRAVAEEIPVLTPTDQETVRELGRAIRAEQDVSVELDRLWPDYIDRGDLQEKIALFALNLDEQHAEADFLAEEDYDIAQIGVSDELGERLNELAAHRTELRALVATGKGLTDIERKQLGATLDDLETGVRGEKTLPEVMYADERTKSDVDYLRTIHAASGIKQQITGTVDQVLTDHRAQVPEQAAATARDAARELGGVVFSIAAGMTEGVKLAREQFLGHRAALGRSLAATGIDVTVKQQLKGAVNDAAARGAEMGQAADQRRQRWEARTEAVVAQRNDRLAQRQALAAGRGARSPRIGHQPTRESAEKTGSPAPARRTPVAQRRTAGAEVGR